MTIIESLKCISGYPIPQNTLQNIAESRGLTPADENTPEVRKSREYKLANADVLTWLSQAPDVSQAGISYSFSDADRLNFRQKANLLYKECEEKPKSNFGYKGNRL